MTSAPSGVYFLLFAVQSLGAAILLWKGIPFYRDFLAGELDPGNQTALWALAVYVLILPAYARTSPMIPNVKSGGWVRVWGGHLVVFLGRLVFTFVGGFFSAVFYARMAEFHFSYRVGLLMALLFSMFCYTLEMEKIGKGLIGSPR